MEKNKNILKKENFIINEVEEKYDTRFDDVTFKYINDDTVLFENLNFKFNKNESYKT